MGNSFFLERTRSTSERPRQTRVSWTATVFTNISPLSADIAKGHFIRITTSLSRTEAWVTCTNLIRPRPPAHLRRLNWRAWWSSRGSRASRSAPWMFLCWAASGRRRTQSAPGGTSCPWRWCSGPWWASGSPSRASRAARGSGSRSTAGRRARRNCRSRRGWSTPADQRHGVTSRLSRQEEEERGRGGGLTRQTKHSGCQRLLSAEM